MYRPLPVCLAIGLILACIAFYGCGSASDTVVAIALHPRDERILYLVTHQGVFKTTDKGQAWRRIFTGVTQSRVLAVSLDPARPSAVFLGTKDDGVYVSYDGGSHWFSRRTGLDDVRVTAEIQQIVFIPGQPSRIFLATAMGVFESDDHGEHWRKRMKGFTDVLMITCMATDPSRSEVLYAGTSAGIYKTTDGAQTWVPSNTGLIPADQIASSRSLGVTALAVDAHHSKMLYAGTLAGLFHSSNGGQSWSRIDEHMNDQVVNAAVVDPAHAGVVYVGGHEGVFMSRDTGLDWEPRNTGLESRNVLALAASPVRPGLLYAGTNGGGLYRSHDEGRTWTPIPLVGE